MLAEGLSRRLPVFSGFLRVAAIGDTEIVNLTNIAQECGVSSPTVRDYYAILEETLLGAFLPAYTLKPKRRTIQAPKFYFRDVGIVNHLTQRGTLMPGSELFGKAFENWVFHELSVYSRYSEIFFELSYWRLSSGIEVDFILGSGVGAIEVKGKKNISEKDLKGLRNFRQDFPSVKLLAVVSLESKLRKTEDGIWIFPWMEFCGRLSDGSLVREMGYT